LHAVLLRRSLASIFLLELQGGLYYPIYHFSKDSDFDDNYPTSHAHIFVSIIFLTLLP